jgi:large subunit ribosomal protein L23
MDILLKPIVTEKMTAQNEKLNCYGFVVDKHTNKIQIRKAVEEMYNVSALAVNTMRYGGKTKSRHTKTGIVKGKAPAFKKAFITLKEGDKIDFFSNI